MHVSLKVAKLEVEVNGVLVRRDALIVGQSVRWIRKATRPGKPSWNVAAKIVKLGKKHVQVEARMTNGDEVTRWVPVDEIDPQG